MSEIIINGLHQLNGKITVQGSKNAALPIMAAAYLCNGITVVENIPLIQDVYNMAKILQCLGCEADFQEDMLIINGKNARMGQIDKELVKKIRASILLAGAMLGRFGEAYIDMPGGCAIGKRPIDIHLEAFGALGFSIEEKEDCFYIRKEKPAQPWVSLRFPSVGATQNIILTCACSKETVVIKNAAREPEICELCRFLNQCGAKISGYGSPIIRIEGVKELNDNVHILSGDRIAAGTYMAACAACQGSVVLEGIAPGDLFPLCDVITAMGADIRERGHQIKITADRRMKNVEFIETAPYPGFPTDMQSQLMAVMLKGVGTCRVYEKIFESRYNVVSEFKKLGSDIEVCGDYVKIVGVDTLKGNRIQGKDLRGVAALVIAGLTSEGETIIEDADYADRGYTDICRSLQILGADIKWNRRKKVQS